MSVILVIERDASRSERISEALRSDGFSVLVAASHAEALSSAEARAPDLLLASSELPDASALLADFSRSRGGPGAVVLAPAATGASAADFQADELLAEPFSDDELREVVRRCVAAALRRQAPAPPHSDDSERLTSADIFGDMLAEVESEVRRSGTAPGARKPSRPMKDIERRLEETLSGVIPIVGKGKRPDVARAPGQREEARKRRPAVNTEIDQLLDQTLSSLDIPTRSRKSEPPAAATPGRVSTPRADIEPAAPAPETSSEPPQIAAPAPELPRLDFEIEPQDATALPDKTPAETAPAESVRFDPVSEQDTSRRRRAEDTPRSPRAEDTPPRDPRAEDAPPRRRAEDAPPRRRAEDLPAPPPPVARPPVAAPADLTPDGDQFRTQVLPTFSLAAEATGGETFGAYTLLDRIAIGGMAEVWRARRRGVEGFQKTVAIKKILSHLTGSKDFVTMFIDEAKLAAQLSHNNIIQIYDLGKVGDDFFIAMEHVEGKDLRSVLTAAQESRRPIPPGLSLLIVSAVASALDYAHRKRDFDNRALGLVHRDVSPQNVMISYEGAIKLCDFGIVKAVAKASTTQLGALKGKLQYMSPEQAWGKSVDARSDIFSLGSVLFEVLTGKQLFSGDSEISVLDAVRECRIRSPREIVPEVPEEVARIVLKALAKSPEERFQTAGDLEQEIRAVLDNLRPTPSQKDLAAYLHSLFELPKSGAVALQDAEKPDDEKPGTEKIDAEELRAEKPPAEKTDVEKLPAEKTGAEKPPAEKTGAEKTGAGHWKWIAAAVLAAILIGVGFLVLPSLLEREASTPPAADPAPPVASPEAPAVDPTPAAAGDTVTGDTVAGDTVAGDTADTAGEPAAGADDNSGTAAGIDIEQIVNEELTQRAERMTRDFEAEKKRIEEELARTRAESRPSSEDAERDVGSDGDDDEDKNGDGES